MEALLQVRDLAVSYSDGARTQIPAVTGVSFDVRAGEAVGILGESGCGKTTTALALTRLLPCTAQIVSGHVLYRDKALLDLPEREMERVRGAQISLIFSEPSVALNPVVCVGDQIVEVIRAHRSWPRRRCRAEAESLLTLVHLQATPRIYRAFPHELSGGQKQRVLIAQAVACGPALVIADEPTASLDTLVQEEILDLLRELKAGSQTSFLFISHHPEVLGRIADRLLVMYAGRIVEEGDLDDIYKSPMHPYTQGLLQASPSKPGEGDACRGKRMSPIPGSPPDMNDLPRGCAFAPRCPSRMEACTLCDPPEKELSGNRTVRCFACGN